MGNAQGTFDATPPSDWVEVKEQEAKLSDLERKLRQNSQWTDDEVSFRERIPGSSHVA